LLGHTDASTAQCIDCGKMLSLGSNKPGKQTVNGLKCHLEKCQNCRTTLGKWNHVNIRTSCKKAKLDEVLAAHCRADLVSECMKKKRICAAEMAVRYAALSGCRKVHACH